MTGQLLRFRSQRVQSKIMAASGEHTEAVSIGLVGCGGISANHLAGIKLLPEAELVAACDLDAQRVADLARRAGISDTYTDYRSLVERDDIEMVDICTNDESHAEIAIAAARAGKHVLMEKPFATSEDEGLAVLGAVGESGVKAMCAQSLRWDPKFRAVKEMVASGRIGEPVYARYSSPSSPFWREEESQRWQDCDPRWLLVHNGMHSFDLISWYFESLPVRVYALSHPGEQWLPVQEYVTCSIRFENGALAQTEENRIMRPPGYPFHCELYLVGTEGTLDLSDRLTHSAGLYNDDGFNLLGAHTTWSPGEPDQPFACEMREFIRAIRTEAEPPIPLEFSMQVLRGVLAAAESMKTGEAVEVAR